jgi:hypothetical protein
MAVIPGADILHPPYPVIPKQQPKVQLPDIERYVMDPIARYKRDFPGEEVPVFVKEVKQPPRIVKEEPETKPLDIKPELEDPGYPVTKGPWDPYRDPLPWEDVFDPNPFWSPGSPTPDFPREPTRPPQPGDPEFVGPLPPDGPPQPGDPDFVGPLPPEGFEGPPRYELPEVDLPEIYGYDELPEEPIRRAPLPQLGPAPRQQYDPGQAFSDLLVGSLIPGVGSSPQQLAETGQYFVRKGGDVIRFIDDKTPKPISDFFNKRVEATIGTGGVLLQGSSELANALSRIGGDLKVSAAQVNVPAKIVDGRYVEVTQAEFNEAPHGTFDVVPYRDLYPGRKTITIRDFVNYARYEPNRLAAEVYQEAKRDINPTYQSAYAELIYKKHKGAIDQAYSISNVHGKRAWNYYWDLEQTTPEGSDIITRWDTALETKAHEISGGRLGTARIAQAALDVVPQTYGEAALGAGVLTLAAPRVALPIIFSKPITEAATTAYESVGDPATREGRFAKAAAAGAAIEGWAPGIGVAYGAEIGKGLIFEPHETIRGSAEYIKERPEEVFGFAIGGGLIRKGATEIEAGIRNIEGRWKGVKRQFDIEIVRDPTFKKATGLDELKVLKHPRFGEIVWIEGKIAQSEKIAVMKQMDKLRGVKQRYFIQVGPEGIPTKMFSNRKGRGFEVREVEQSMRGLYEAPPSTFLEKALGVQGEAGAYSFYAQLRGDRFRLPNPVDAVTAVLTGKEFKRTRPMLNIRRTLKPHKVERWVVEVAEHFNEGKPLTKSAKLKLNEWYKKFKERPHEMLNGQVMKGEAKQAYVHRYNLQNKGKGKQLEAYMALLEYQFQTGKSLPGGPELLSGILPYGPESQILVAPGTRYFEKSAVDLRRARERTRVGRTVDWLTGTPRGEFFAEIPGAGLLEIQPQRAFPGRKPTIPELPKGKEVITKKGEIKRSPAGILNSFLKKEPPSLTGGIPFEFEGLRFSSDYKVPRVKGVSKKVIEEARKGIQEAQRKVREAQRKVFANVPETIDLLETVPRRRVRGYAAPPRPFTLGQRQAETFVEGLVGRPERLTRRPTRPTRRPERYDLFETPTRRRRREEDRRPRLRPPRELQRRREEERARERARARERERREERRIIERQRRRRKPFFDPFLIREKEKRPTKKKKVKKKKKPRKYILRPTAFQLTEGVGMPTGEKAIQQITGFEVRR